MVKGSIEQGSWQLVRDVVKHDHHAWRGDRSLHYQQADLRLGATALKFPGLWVLVSGFLRLVTVWLHVDRGGVTGSCGP
jgi:hypothetical protein